MKIVFVESGEHEPLADSEIKAVCAIFDAGAKTEKHGRLIIISSDKIREKQAVLMQERLALTKSAGALLFSCSKKEMDKKISGFSWEKEYSSSFSVRIKDINQKEANITLLEREIGGKIFDILSSKGKKPKVSLEQPGTKIEFFFTGKEVFAAKIIAEQKEDFKAREPRFRPGFSPVSMSPKISRCMVNLLQAKKGEAVFDPFCGTGGMLIEAALMGLKAEGSDIDSEMIEKSRANFSFYKINGRIKAGDASSISGKKKFIVCDLPYGVSSFLSEKKQSLYPKFMKALNASLGKRAVLCIKKGSDEKLIRKGLRSLEIKERFEYYIHKSMTKKIIVIERKK
jgi:tRNA (guanine10-N2)-dimethyltransferase